MTSRAIGARRVLEVPDNAQRRLILQQLHLGNGYVIVVGSVYLTRGVGIVDDNEDLIKYLATALQSFPFPFMLGSGWNVQPEELMDF